jgi:hypothetical protein
MDGGSVAARSATRALTLLGFVDLECAPVHVLAVQCLHGARGLGIRHLDETESARAAGIAIGDQGDFLDRAVWREQRTHRVFGRGERKISNVEFGHCKLLTNRKGNGQEGQASWFADTSVVADFGRDARRNGAIGQERQAKRSRAGATLQEFRPRRLPFACESLKTL